MINNKNIIIVLSSIICIGCFQRKNPYYSFINESNNKIDSVYIYTSEAFIIDDYNYIEKAYNLKPKEQIKGKIRFYNTTHADGSYFVEVFKKNKTIRQPFGYYTNGHSINYKFDITIYKNDSIGIVTK